MHRPVQSGVFHRNSYVFNVGSRAAMSCKKCPPIFRSSFDVRRSSARGGATPQYRSDRPGSAHPWAPPAPRDARATRPNCRLQHAMSIQPITRHHARRNEDNDHSRVQYYRTGTGHHTHAHVARYEETGHPVSLGPKRSTRSAGMLRSSITSQTDHGTKWLLAS